MFALQLALWEEYADEVEEQMRVLLADNALLQAALADVRSSLAHERPSSAGRPPPYILCYDYSLCVPCAAPGVVHVLHVAAVEVVRLPAAARPEFSRGS
jgi:hypothetical protein